MACTIVKPRFFKCQVDLPAAGRQSKTNTYASRRSWLTMPPWRCSKVPLGVMFNHQIQVSDSEGIHGAASSSRDFSQKQHSIFLSSANSWIAKNPKPAEAWSEWWRSSFCFNKGSDWLVDIAQQPVHERDLCGVFNSRAGNVLKLLQLSSTKGTVWYLKKTQQQPYNLCIYLWWIYTSYYWMWSKIIHEKLPFINIYQQAVSLLPCDHAISHSNSDSEIVPIISFKNSENVNKFKGESG